MAQKTTKSKNLRKKLFDGRKTAPCCYCGITLTHDTATLEHVKPKALGGSNDLDNLALACQPCNYKKGQEIPKRLPTYPDDYRLQAIKDCVKGSGLKLDQICEIIRLIRLGDFIHRKRITGHKKKYTVVLNSRMYVCYYNHGFGVTYKIENKA